MKKSKEYKISITLFCICLVLYIVSIVTSLIPGLTYSIDKISMYLGFAFFGFGLMFLAKAKDKDDSKDKKDE